MNLRPELDGKLVKVTQVRSESGNTKRVHQTLQALGLGRIGLSREHKINACVWGMLRKVRHLIRVSQLS